VRPRRPAKDRSTQDSGSGLVYTVLMAFAPLSVALPLGSAAVITGIAVTLGYCLSLRGRARAA